MGFDNMTARLFRVCEIICKMAYVNVLWIIFTLFGLVAFGFFPSTVALFAVTRKWIMGEHSIPVFTTFWSVFRQEFFKSTWLGIGLFIIGYILYIDLAYLPTGGLFTIL